MSQDILLRLPPGLSEKGCCTFRSPPLDGSLTIPEIFDWHYVNNPMHPVFTYDDCIKGLQNLYFSDVVPAIHNAARYVTSVRDGSVCNNQDQAIPPIAILAASDNATYFCVIVGMMLVHIPVFPISPRNSPTAIAHLLRTMKVNQVLVGDHSSVEDLFRQTTDILNGDGWTTPHMVPMPGFLDLFCSNGTEFSLDTHTQMEPRDYNKPVLYAHSSGSSSSPRPVPWNHASLLQVAMTPYLGAYDLRGEVFGAHAVSMFHASGLNFIPWVASAGFTMAIFSPMDPNPLPTAENVLHGLITCSATYLICVPSFLEAWAVDPAAVDALKCLRAVAYGGGPLPEAVGDFLIAQGVKVITVIGSTEAGVIGSLFSECQGRDWPYFSLNPHCAAEFEPQGDGTYELIVVKRPTQVLLVTNTSFQGNDAYATRDLFLPHPKKPGYWRVFGRADDQITLSNGVKINPGPLEAVLTQHPLIDAAIMFGRGHSQAGVIIFASSDSQLDTDILVGRQRFLDMISDLVSKMNSSGPPYARIFTEMIILASPDKPLSFTNKGTIRRTAVLEAYQDEIDNIYRCVEEGSSGDTDLPLIWTLENALAFVQTSVKSVLPGIDNDTVNFFSKGCDSLQATWIRKKIVDALRSSSDLGKHVHVPSSVVYQYPSIDSLAYFIVNIVGGINHSDMAPLLSTGDLEASVARFTRSFPPQAPCRVSSNNTSHVGDVVLVTGTTGTLGCNVLAVLVRSQHVARVYALNRRSLDGESIVPRQQKSLIAQGLSPALATSPKVIYVESNLEHGEVAIDLSVRNELQEFVTHVVHTAWPVNFNLGLVSFEGALTALRTLIDFALASSQSPSPRFVFVSSIGTYRHLGRNQPKLLEEAPCEDAERVADTGYSQSKWIAERILDTVSQKTTLRPLIIRLGQVSGSIGGTWNTSEWFPALVKTSIGIGFLPRFSGVVSWVPVDIAAEAIVDLRNVCLPVLHVVHPRPVPWNEILDDLGELLSLPSHSFRDWFKALQAQHSSIDSAERVTIDDVHRFPALKLLEFFRQLDTSLADTGDTGSMEAFGGLRADAHEGFRHSISLRNARPIGHDDVHSWIHRWKDCGFL